MSLHPPQELQRIYHQRFGGQDDLEYRRAVWRILIADFFGRFLRPEHSLLDLGCGYGEFVNQVACARRVAMDLNPGTAERLLPGITLLQQDCSERWPLTDSSLDVVFTSNFFEHLPDKIALGKTLDEIRRCLKPGGLLLALGPNIKHLPGRYWDFWDHYVPLTECSVREALETRGFGIKLCLEKFLPYTMSGGRRVPLLLVRLYLRLPFAWRIFGKQFLVVARKGQQESSS